MVLMTQEHKELRAEIDRLRDALKEVAATWDTGPTTVMEGMKATCLEFQRRWEIANDALGRSDRKVTHGE